ncbi:ricin-type beta-trefoil lectin domain protein [Spongiactinospora sp. 9N601]|uniref:ricin-type beta-trefoil lectin domain protein n=1 Tax=Spongiactinospora sp. 9N601 TaxID=3375149 RepID=UPI00379FF964
MLQALQRDLRLTAEQVRVRQAHEATAATLERRLRERLGERIGGTWYDAGKERLSVGVLNDKDAKAVRDAGATPVPVRHSEKRLAATKETLDRAAKAADDKIYGWHVDVPANAVLVSAADQAAGERFVRAAGLTAGEEVRITQGRAFKPVGDIRGGDAFFSPTDTPGIYTACSVGFSVDNGGFITAGHCGKAGAITKGHDWSDQGVFAGSTFPGGDYAWVMLYQGTKWATRPWVNDYNGNNVKVAGSQEAPIGSSICRSGRTTHWRCGVVQAKDVTAHYSDTAIVEGLTKTSACAEPGDSGGSFISDDEAQGVTSGGAGGCSDGGISLFQPINPILHTYDLTLTTTKRSGSIVGWQDKCIDVPDSDGVEGQRPWLWDCNNTGAQLWNFHRDGTIRNFALCLDTAGGSTAVGAAVQLSRCGGAASQKFSLTTAGALVNTNSGKCVQVVGAGGLSSRFELGTCNGSAHQKWRKV